LKEAKSAKTPSIRPLFNEMIGMIYKQKAEGILTWQINRLSRNPMESGILQQLLQDKKIKSIQTIDRQYRPEDNAIIFSV
jgi:DNA invertase Pin-like site-specific DNA recombinase